MEEMKCYKDRKVGLVWIMNAAESLSSSANLSLLINGMAGKSRAEENQPQGPVEDKPCDTGR